MDGQQRRKLQQALLDAFPNKSSLEQMLSFGLEKNLNEIAKEGNLQEVVFTLIKTAECQGWIQDLVRAAKASNSGNLNLKNIALELLSNAVTEAINIDELVQTTYKQPTVAVISASGSGKSPVVFARLISKLRSKGTWSISFGFITIIFLTIFLGFSNREIRITQLRNDVDKAKGQKDNYIVLKALEELVKLNEPLNNIELKGANLSGSNLSGGKLESANLYGAILENANLNGAILVNAILPSAVLKSAKLKSADLSGADLKGVTLESAILESANLESANFVNVILVGAIFKGANLSGSNISGSDLRDAKFGCIEKNDKKIQCTNLKKVENLTTGQVKQAKNWQSACYDPDFRKQLGLPPQNPKCAGE